MKKQKLKKRIDLTTMVVNRLTDAQLHKVTGGNGRTGTPAPPPTADPTGHKGPIAFPS